MRKKSVLAFIVILLFSLCSPAQKTDEKLLSDENAYNPIPSLDGKLIAYVRMGWGRNKGTTGFGRSNLRSEIAVMTPTGKVLSPTPLADAFLFGWSSDGNHLVCYRDWRFFLVDPDKGVLRKADEAGGDDGFNRSERVAYLSKANTFLWVEHRVLSVRVRGRRSTGI
jgi:hypothetical protein